MSSSTSTITTCTNNSGADILDGAATGKASDSSDTARTRRSAAEQVSGVRRGHGEPRGIRLPRRPDLLHRRDRSIPRSNRRCGRLRRRCSGYLRARGGRRGGAGVLIQ